MDKAFIYEHKQDFQRMGCLRRGEGGGVQGSEVEGNESEMAGNGIMSAYPKDNSNTGLSSRRSGMCLRCRPSSCPPPRTLEGQETLVRQESNLSFLRTQVSSS